MKIPQSVRIGGVEYPIVYVPNLRYGSQIAYGHIDYENCTIELSDTDGTAHEKRCQILWHEILHGIRNHAGLEIEDEEAVIDMFAKGIYQVLQDNGGRLFDLREREEHHELKPVQCGAYKPPVSRNEILKRAILTFGNHMQMTVAIEELSELQKEICKWLRNNDNLDHLSEEIADVEIMLEQLKMMFKCGEGVSNWKACKLERLLHRIEVAEKGCGT